MSSLELLRNYKHLRLKRANLVVEESDTEFTSEMSLGKAATF